MTTPETTRGPFRNISTLYQYPGEILPYPFNFEPTGDPLLNPNGTARYLDLQFEPGAGISVYPDWEILTTSVVAKLFLSASATPGTIIVSSARVYLNNGTVYQKFVGTVVLDPAFGRKSASGSGVSSGFTYIKSVATAPSAAPSPPAGTADMVYCTADHKVYIYDAGNGGWKGLLPT